MPQVNQGRQSIKSCTQTPGCLLGDGHVGNCTPQPESCPTTGCTLPKNHGGDCNARA